MNLFNPDPKLNLLPCDGFVGYHGVVFTDEQRAQILERLKNEIPWQHDELTMFGKRIITARKVAWFADSGLSYSYSGTTKTAHAWNPLLSELKKICESLTGESYSSCLLNLYHGGNEGMGWHSDNERTIEPGSSIASLSFGAERKFSFKHKRTKEVISLLLDDGSLLDMRGATQKHWLHQLPKTKMVNTERINLTFRRMLKV